MVRIMIWGRLFMISGDHWVVSRKIRDFLFLDHRGFENKRELNGYGDVVVMQFFVYLVGEE